MRRLVLLSVFFLVGIFVNAQTGIVQKVYVGTFTSEGAEGICQCEFNSKTGDISLNKTIKGIDNPSFLKISDDKKYLYAVSRTTKEVEASGGYVIAYEIGKDGSLKFLNKQISNGEGPCHVDVSIDGKYVAIATYGSGTTSLYPLKKNGKLKPASSLIINKGSSIDKTRQTVPHAHSIKFSPFDSSVFSADLGTDQLNIFDLEGDRLVKADQPFVKIEPGAGPRHLEFHPKGGIIYVINELNSTITTLKHEGNTWKIVQNISTLPENFDGDSFCADIHISKDGKYIYGSNRGHNSIAVFSVDQDSKLLKFKQTVAVEGNWPRNFVLSSEGKWMLVANQKSGNITVFKIDAKTGVPKYTGKEIKLPAPVCLEFL